ncbi:MAG TPA: biopolymer transporter ExbD [Candidatus Dormibacteraeota bacterium]|nr:biopolymer transporter ExbD [Candidatus Dormibacteraeota bacterium]
MRFRVRKRRTAPAVIIVALIDVLIVLVIFLLVTTTFKQQSALKLALPESSQAKKAGANENPPLVVSIDANGIYYLDKLPKTFEQLQGELMSHAAKDPKLVLAINADEKAPWGKIVKVRDAAAKANIKSLVAFTKETAKP